MVFGIELGAPKELVFVIPGISMGVDEETDGETSLGAFYNKNLQGSPFSVWTLFSIRAVFHTKTEEEYLEKNTDLRKK